MSSNITLEHYLILSSCIFAIGVSGLLVNRQTVISILLSIELMLLAVNLNFVVFSVYLQELSGQVFSIIILTVAAAETSIGLAILVAYFRNKGAMEVTDINKMKG